MVEIASLFGETLSEFVQKSLLSVLCKSWERNSMDSETAKRIEEQRKKNDSRFLSKTDHVNESPSLEFMFKRVMNFKEASLPFF